MTAPLIIDGLPIRIRPFERSDEAFVMGTWLNSALRTARHGAPDPFFRWMRPTVEEGVSSDLIRIACLEEKPSTIVSWAALRPSGRTSYAYTVDNPRTGVSFRGHGLMRLLTETL